MQEKLEQLTNISREKDKVRENIQEKRKDFDKFVEYLKEHGNKAPQDMVDNAKLMNDDIKNLEIKYSKLEKEYIQLLDKI